MANPEKQIKELYLEHSESIYRFLYWQTGDALLAEDITSEVFYRAWAHYKTLKKGNQRAWLYRVARNLVIDHWRKKKEQHIEDLDVFISDYNLVEEAAKKEDIIKVRKMIADLSPTLKSVIILRFFEQLSYEEVGAILDKTPGNIRILQFRALKALKKEFTK